MHRGVQRLRQGPIMAMGMLGALLPGIPLAENHAHHTAQGVAVATPAIASLDCPAMRAVLDAIDSSGYRGTRPEPLHSADRALLDYEHRLSTQYYARCVSALTRSLQATTPFSYGFSEDPRE